MSELVVLKNALDEFEGILNESAYALENKDINAIQVVGYKVGEWKLKYKNSKIIACLHAGLSAALNSQDPFNSLDSAEAYISKIKHDLLASASHDARSSIRCLAAKNFEATRIYASTAGVKARNAK